jgi:hypothetical protein
VHGYTCTAHASNPAGGGHPGRVSGSTQGKVLTEGKANPDPGRLQQKEEQTASDSWLRIKS